MVRADLHCHSRASDGTRTPAEVVCAAAAAGVDVLALTDHDTVAGIAEAAAALRPGLRLLPGMELSCKHQGQSIHLLAYLFDPEHGELAAECAAIRSSRRQRAAAMVARLADLGVPVSWEQVSSIADGGVVGRPHIARAMVAAGAVGSVEEAFTSDWLGPGGRAYVGRYALDPQDAIGLVRAAGGVTVLAHPLAGRRGRPVPADLIIRLAGAGLTGLEVAHPSHDADQRAALNRVAAELGLAVTGGSDDHGELTGDRIGCETTSERDLAALIDGATGWTLLSC